MSLVAIRRLSLAVACVVTAQAWYSQPALGQQLLVGAASSLRDALSQVTRSYGVSSQTHLDFSFGSSTEIVRQAKLGAPFDVVMTADQRTMDTLGAAGLVLSGARVDIVGNTLALIVPKASAGLAIASPRDLLSPSVRRVAVCEPGVPAGHYTIELLKRLGLLERLRGKLVTAPHVRAALSLVAHGAVDAGFVYSTDISAASGKVVPVFHVGRREGLDIRYVAAVLSTSSHLDQARAFVRHLQSEQSWAIWQSLGFQHL